jgi:AraC family transcriptional regulator
MTAKVKSGNDEPFRTVQQLDLSKFKLNESAAAGGIGIPMHSHEQTHITLILEGACRETYIGREQDIGRLGVTYFHPGQSHGLELHPGAFRSFDIEINQEWLDGLIEKTIPPSALFDTPADSIARLAARVYREFKYMDDVSELAMEGLALEMLAELSRSARRTKTKKAPRWLQRVVELVHDEFARPLTLSDLAASAGVHPAHLAQVFRNQYHCTPGQYIRQLRIECAIQQMSDSNASLADISLATGFADQSHFSRVFKRHTGMTPAGFRQLRLETRSLQEIGNLGKTDCKS